jgi:hypothetical protein
MRNPISVIANGILIKIGDLCGMNLRGGLTYEERVWAKEKLYSRNPGPPPWEKKEDSVKDSDGERANAVQGPVDRSTESLQ